MQDAGYAHMGVGRAAGKDKAEQAAVAAISSPLLETAPSQAPRASSSTSSPLRTSPSTIDVASQLITERASEDANIIWGAAFDETMEDEMMVTVIATGFDGMNGEKTQKPATPAISDAQTSLATRLRRAPAAQLPRRATMIPSPTSCPSSTESNLELQIKQGIGLDTLSL